MNAIKVFVLLAMALGLVGCGGSPAATPVPCSGTGSPISCVPTVNGQRIDQARTCDSIVGQVLTKADETTICALLDGTIETPNATVCGNGQTFINFGLSPAVEGIAGQKAYKHIGDESLDRETCETEPMTTLSSAVAPTPSATVASPAPMSAASVCILQVPAQILTDYTPITLVYSGTDAAQCAQYLAAQPTAGNAWEAEHPPTIVSAVPAGSPVCTGTMGGLTIAIYGTAAAQYACSSLGLK